MKKLIICIALTSCWSYNEQVIAPKMQDVIVLVDHTNPKKTDEKIATEDMERLLDVTSHNRMSGATVMFVPITDLRLNPTFTAKIPQFDAKDINANEADRSGAFKAFKKQLVSCVRAMNALPTGTKQSYVFENIQATLIELTRCPSTHEKHLYVISDLRQNTSQFNAYDIEIIKYCEKHPKAFFQYFDSAWTLPSSLKGITVHLVHKPKDQEDDYVFSVVGNLLSAYLTRRGAVVIISTTFYAKIWA